MHHRDRAGPTERPRLAEGKPRRGNRRRSKRRCRAHTPDTRPDSARQPPAPPFPAASHLPLRPFPRHLRPRRLQFHHRPTRRRLRPGCAVDPQAAAWSSNSKATFRPMIERMRQHRPCHCRLHGSSCCSRRAAAESGASVAIPQETEGGRWRDPFLAARSGPPMTRRMRPGPLGERGTCGPGACRCLADWP